jgi:hypothetical protein
LTNEVNDSLISKQERAREERSMLTHIAEDLYAFETMLSLPLGLRLPTRCTVVRLSDGSVLLHSPVPIDDATAASIDALGEVRVIVAPSNIHHLFLTAAAKRYPAARVYATPALRKNVPGVPGTHLLDTSERGAPFPGLASSFLAGVPRIDETVFFHERSGSLLCTDMVFNITQPSTFGTKLFMTCVGCNGRFAQSRVWRVLSKNDALLASRSARVLDWSFARVVMGHGDVLSDDAHARTREALARYLRAAPPRLAA